MLLEMLADFQSARPGLLLTFHTEEGMVRILALRGPTEECRARFLHWTCADPMDGDLTPALNEIAEALEDHDRQYSENRRMLVAC